MKKRISYLLISLTIGVVLFNLLLGATAYKEMMDIVKGIAIKILFIISILIIQSILLKNYVNKKTGNLDFLFILTAVISVVLIIDYVNFNMIVSTYKNKNYSIPEHVKQFIGNSDPLKNLNPYFNTSAIELIPTAFQVTLFVIKRRNANVIETIS